LSEPEVVVLGDGFESSVQHLLARYGMTLARVPAGVAIPGSWWGEREAGLRGAVLYARPDTPLHSVLHEACHYVCMSPGRRSALDTDAGGGYDEENGVCYLQVLLADELPGFGRARMFADMDAWGYSFRLGSARAWFEQDAGDALQWLQRYALADAEGQPTWRLRES
jgi:hypothetical protein